MEPRITGIPTFNGERPDMNDSDTGPTRKVLAISSGGGHWIQLCRVLPAIEQNEVVLATVQTDATAPIEPVRRYAVPDATRKTPLRLVWLTIKVLYIILRERPMVVMSTGAAHGLLALTIAKRLRPATRTIWLDSIANAEKLSLSGEKAGRVADLWLTQWEHLERPDGPEFKGTVL